MPFERLRLILITVLLGAGAGGCEKSDQQIKVYRVEKAPLKAPAAAPEGESRPPPDLPPSHPPIGGGSAVPAAVGSAAAPPIVASAAAPPNWESQPTSEMRKASYLVKGTDGSSADISLVTLGGTAGNVLDNVNRWLGQLKQPPLTAEQLPQVVRHLPAGQGHVAFVDLQGEPEQGDPQKDGRIIAAIATADGSTSFYKMRGNIALVGAEKENFVKWVTATAERR
jgi:hypothetical protein